MGRSVGPFRAGHGKAPCSYPGLDAKRQPLLRVRRR